MIEIEVDTEVYEFLKRNAEPFADTPNDVLRRLLLKSGSRSSEHSAVRQPRRHAVQTEEFVSRIVAEVESESGESFTRKPPYRYMFESDGRILYFQNFNKEGVENLWFRINEGAMTDLAEDDRTALVYFTNPSAGFAYVIPFDDIRERMRRAEWTREDLEVNIDHAGHRWRDLDWDIGAYLKTYRLATEGRGSN